MHASVIAGRQIKREMPFQLWGDSGSQHTHTHSITQSRRRVSRWALSQAAKQITSRYDICRQADRGGRSVPAGREQQLAAPSPGISSPSWQRERETWKWRRETGINWGFQFCFYAYPVSSSYLTLNLNPFFFLWYFNHLLHVGELQNSGTSNFTH